jgi:hypothetical protein
MARDAHASRDTVAPAAWLVKLKRHATPFLCRIDAPALRDTIPLPQVVMLKRRATPLLLPHGS